MKKERNKIQNNKNHKLGFTLLELLVVVLIIGILAAIALPQYQLARDKAQFSNFQNQVKSIKAAVDSYRLIHNEYPTDFDELDIDFSSSYQKTSHRYNGENRGGCIIFQDSYCCIDKYVSGYQSAKIICGRNDYLFAYVFSLYSSYCMAQNGSSRASRLCKNFSYSGTNTGNITTPYGHDTNNGKQYTTYQLR